MSKKTVKTIENQMLSDVTIHPESEKSRELHTGDTGILLGKMPQAMNPSTELLLIVSYTFNP